MSPRISPERHICETLYDDSGEPIATARGEQPLSPGARNALTNLAMAARRDISAAVDAHRRADAEETPDA